MKKIVTFLMAAMLCFSLVACGGGGVDKQPAIDAYNDLVENYNMFAEKSNEDLSGWTEEDIDFMNSFGETISDYGKKLDSDKEFTQDEIDEMIDELNEVNDIIKEYL